MKLNGDGKFLDRLIPALIAAAIGVGGAAIVFWADSRATDLQTREDIKRINDDIKTVREEAKEARQSAAADRQKTAELAGDVRNVLRSTSRIESILDRYMQPGPPAGRMTP